MNAYDLILTFTHFLWQATLVAGCLAISLRIGGKLQSNTRYLIASFAFALLPTCVVATYSYVRTTDAIVSSLNPTLVINDSQTPSVALKPAQPNTRPFETGEHSQVHLPGGSAAHFWLRRWATPLLAVYSLGACLMLLRVTLAVRSSQKLRREVREIHDPTVLQIFAEQTQRMALRAAPSLAMCHRIVSPVVIGILRPTILLPPALLCEIDTEQLAMILRHEMAHIRRYDLLFNTMQRIIESLLFFHPATWWISNCMSIERENCCDDWAAAETSRVQYAAALIKMATICKAPQTQNRWTGSQISDINTVAASGNSSAQLSNRIHRLLAVKQRQGFPGTTSISAFAALLLLIAFSVWTFANEDTPASEPTPLTPKAVSEMHTADTDRIYWSDRNHEGLVAGMRVMQWPTQEVPTVRVQHLLHNTASEPKTVNLSIHGRQESRISIDAANRVDVTFSGGSWQEDHSLAPDQTLAPSHWQSDINVGVLEPGIFSLRLGPVFFVPIEGQVGTRTGVPFSLKLSLEIAGDSENASVLADTEIEKREIQWGEAVGGVRVGATFEGVRSSPANRFGLNDRAVLQLFIQNVSKKEIESRILLPHTHDRWGLSIEDVDGKHQHRNQTIFSAFQTLQTLAIDLEPGEIQSIHGNTPLEKVEFVIVQDAPKAQHLPPYAYKLSPGNYKAQVHINLRRPDKPGVTYDARTAKVKFRVGKAKVRATTNLKWFAEGQVTDAQGRPLKGVEIRTNSGMFSLHGRSKTTTDADGKYRLEFGEGIFMESDDGANLQYAHVSAHLDGHAEQNLNRHGAGWMARVEVGDEHFYQKRPRSVALPGKPRRVDFVMTTAARIEGKLVGTGSFSNLFLDAEGKITVPDTVELDKTPLVGWKVWLKGKDLPPGWSILDEVRTDENGAFVFENVPIGFDWEIQTQTNLADHPEPKSGSFRIGAIANGKRTHQLELELFEDQKRVYKTLSAK